MLASPRQGCLDRFHDASIVARLVPVAYTVTVPAPAPAPIPRWVELLGVAAAAGAALGMASFVLRGVDGARMFELWVPHNGGVGLLGSALALVALRRNPQNRCVQAIFVASVTAGVHVAATAIADARIAQRPGLRQDLAAGAVALVELPADVAWPLWLMTWIWIVSASFLVVIAMLLVPYGRLPSRRWRPGLWVAFAGIAVTAAGYAWGNRPWSPYRLVFNEAPLADPVAAVLVTVGLPLLGAAALVTAASLIVRLRTAPSDERRQVRPSPLPPR